MPDRELLTIIATIVGTVLFTLAVYIIVVGVLVSLLVGVVGWAVSLAHKIKEVYGHSTNGRGGHSLGRLMGLVRPQKRRLT
jgi:hypothetical protein